MNQYLIKKRNKAIWEMYTQGHKVSDIADHFGMKIRAVYYAISRVSKKIEEQEDVELHY